MNLVEEVQIALRNSWVKISEQDQASFKAIVEAARRWVAIQKAITNEGKSPFHHRRMMARLKEEWPTLWAALTSGDTDTMPAVKNQMWSDEHPENAN